MYKAYLVALACIQSVTWAGGTEIYSEKDYFAEQPIVLSAARLGVLDKKRLSRSVFPEAWRELVR